MALPPITIPDLDSAISPINPNADFLILRQGLNDKKATATQILQSLTDQLQLSSNSFALTWQGVSTPPNPNYGYYTRVKDIVFITINCVFINSTVQSQPLKMTTLPFFSRNDPNFICAMECAVGNFSNAAGKNLSGRINPNSKTLSIHSVDSAGLGSDFTLSIASGGQLTITGFYFAQ